MIVGILGVSLQSLWGGVDSLTWVFLIGEIVCGTVGILGWWILSNLINRSPAETGRYGVLPWLAFPMTVFATLLMIPLLILAVYPESRTWLSPKNRITLRQKDEVLEITFPQPTTGTIINIQFDDIPISPRRLKEIPQISQWRDLSNKNDNRVLRLNYTVLQKEFKISNPGRIGINAMPNEDQIFYKSGGRIPQQWIELPR